MSLVTAKEILVPARREGRAIGAFNIANFETGVAVVEAAEAEKYPVIIQVYQRLMMGRHIDALAAMMLCLARGSSVPIAIHLDHGASLEQVELALKLGFTSVMFDGSTLPLEENVSKTKEAVKMAAKSGSSVEAEIGHVPLSGQDDIPLPTPSEISSFAERTGVDSLAVAVGTVHGYYKGEPKIDLELGRKAGEAVKIPLVLHGGSGTPEATVRSLIKSGFAKVNVATEFQHAFQKRLTKDLEDLQGKFLPADKLMVASTEDASALLRKFIRIFSNP